MNPFQRIAPEKGLVIDHKSPFYGRFRLRFNQVSPFREPTFDRVFIKINRGFETTLQHIYELFPEYLKHEIQLYHQKEIRNNQRIQIDCFDDKDWLLCLSMMGDVAFICSYNFYFALLKVSQYLENCRFFIYSSGDLNHRWIDEYNINSGVLQCSRNMMKTESYWGAILYYLKRTSQQNNAEFKRFTAFQLYDLLYGDAYQYQEQRQNAKVYDEFGEEITEDIQEHIETMTPEEFIEINDLLKTIFDMELNQELKQQIDKRYHFNLLAWKI